MPFTPTHLAAIVPIAGLSGNLLPFSALAIGSMVPDWPLFVPIPCSYGTTHSLRGLFLADWPLGFAGFLIFHFWCKRPLADLLPWPIRRRVESLAEFAPDLSIGGLLRVSLAVVIGAATHLFWDSFTHEGRWGTQRFPWLEASLFEIAGHPVPGYKALQYGSTFFFLPVLLILLVRWISRQEPLERGMGKVPDARRRCTAWIVMALIPIVVALFLAIEGRGTPYEQLGRLVRILGRILLVSTLAICLILNIRRSAGARKLIRVTWLFLEILFSLILVSSHLAYTTAGFDFEWPAGESVEVLYLRIRWDDGSTWIGYAVQPVTRPGHELEWFDPGGTLFANPTHPRHRTVGNDLGFWRIVRPSDDPYVAKRYPGATASEWLACPSWLMLLGLWGRTIARGLGSIRNIVFRGKPDS